jgi:cysteinyl-tRNA synthetase
MSFKIYNTLTRKTEEFKPVDSGRVGIYVCGPTVYGHAHLGHAKSYVSFDVLVRYLRYLGYSVKYVQNITDVGHLTDDADEGEDKLAKQAAKERKHPMEIAEYYTKSFFEDMDELGCLRPDISPRASGHIPEQIELVERLVEKGFAYEVNGSVYYDVSKFKDYGKLSGRKLEDMEHGSRFEVKQEKRHPSDFALWKKAEPNHIMQWQSPWGMGYPGWHLECSVMSMKYLGKTIDIHGGGLENQFPHHECEIAQSEAANDAPFVKYWVHNNMVTVNGQKMGKSLNNFITLKQLFSGEHELLGQAYEPFAVRMFILQSHYRSTLDFSDKALKAAQSGYDRIAEAVKQVRKLKGTSESGGVSDSVAGELGHLKKRFEGAMNDDLNTSVALSVIFDMVKLAGTVIGDSSTTAETFEALDDEFRSLGGGVLGIVPDEYPAEGGGDDALLDYLVGQVVEQRQAAKANKDYATADAIRDKLNELGIVLEDKPGGETGWRRK